MAGQLDPRRLPVFAVIFICRQRNINGPIRRGCPVIILLARQAFGGIFLLLLLLMLVLALLSLWFVIDATTVSLRAQAATDFHPTASVAHGDERV